MSLGEARNTGVNPSPDTRQTWRTTEFFAAA